MSAYDKGLFLKQAFGRNSGPSMHSHCKSSPGIESRLEEGISQTGFPPARSTQRDKTTRPEIWPRFRPYSQANTTVGLLTRKCLAPVGRNHRIEAGLIFNRQGGLTSTGRREGRHRRDKRIDLTIQQRSAISRLELFDVILTA